MVGIMWELTIITDTILEETCLWRVTDWDVLGVATETRDGILRVRIFSRVPLTPKTLALLETDLTQDAATFGLAMPKLETIEIPHQDWATQWMTHWHPRPVGEKFMICPVWMTCEPGERLVLKLDAGLAFGTGEHETSRLCLQALERCIKGGERVADIGCGSGILTIGALLLGAASAQAVDLEDQAVSATAQNLAHNGLIAIVKEGSVSGITPPVDGILCNILAPVILELLPQIEDLLQPGAWAIFSGTLITQIPQITAAFGDRWLLQETLTEGQWAALIAQRA